MSAAERDPLSKEAAARKEAGGGRHPIRDFWQGLVTNGEASGTSGRQVFLYSLAAAALLSGAINTVNVITLFHDQPEIGTAAPIVWEGSSFVTLLAFLWIPWIAWRIAPPLRARPRWRLLIHPIAAVAYSFAHVVGFVGIRKLIYWLAGDRYDFGDFGTQFLYELRKDAFAYLILIAVFTLTERLLAQPQQPANGLFDIRDGARLTRVKLEEVLAVASAGNYVEFVMRDGRRLLMRSPLSALEDELSPKGFVRTHRSWLVNRGAVTSLTPEGSGDYEVALGALTVPLSRRFPQALAQLRTQ